MNAAYEHIKGFIRWEYETNGDNACAFIAQHFQNSLRPVNLSITDREILRKGVGFARDHANNHPRVADAYYEAANELETMIFQGHTITPTVALPFDVGDTTGPVHSLVGFDIVAAYLAYTKPVTDYVTTERFATVEGLQARLSSQYDHALSNGDPAVYELAGDGYHDITAPIDFNAANVIITTDIRNPSTLDGGGDRTGAEGAHFAFLLDNCSNVTIANFNIVGMRYHGVAVGREDNEPGGTDNKILNNIISDCGTSGIAIRNGANGTLVEGNTGFDIGSGDTRGEFIYLGYGPDYTSGQMVNHVFNTVIRGNEAYNLNAEAIDVKRLSRGVTIEYNFFHDVNVKSQGAITCMLAVNDLTPATYNADLIVRHNVVCDTTTRDTNGDGIVIALGTAHVYGNICFNNAGAGIIFYSDFDGPNTDAHAEANICWNNAGGDIVENSINGNGTSTALAVVTRAKNYVSTGAINDETTTSEFQGPFPATNVVAFSPATVAGLPAIVSPANGATLSGTSHTVTWNTGGLTGIEKWVIKVGSTAGGNDHAAVLIEEPTATQVTVSNLPGDGSPVYFTLFHYREADDPPWTSASAQVVADSVPTLLALPTATPTTTTVQIDWGLSEGGTGQIEYGPSADNLNLTSTKETSFTYSNHTQQLTGFSPGEQVFYRVAGEFQDASTYTSQVYSVTTMASVIIAPSTDNAASTVNVQQFLNNGYAVQWSDTPTVNDLGMTMYDYYETDHWSNGEANYRNTHGYSGAADNTLYNVVAIDPVEGLPAARLRVPYAYARGISVLGNQFGRNGLSKRKLVFHYEYMTPLGQYKIQHPHPWVVGRYNNGMYIANGQFYFHTPAHRDLLAVNVTANVSGGGQSFHGSASVRTAIAGSGSVDGKKGHYFNWCYLDQDVDAASKGRGINSNHNVFWNNKHGQWVSVDTEIHLNDVGQNNGTIAIYEDGVLMQSTSGLGIVGTADQLADGWASLYEHYTVQNPIEERLYIRNQIILGKD